ncbi:MAG: adenylosuccinate lyase [Armatimonadota bacterium]|nr:adenylosuccinate lyase [Armatimonadota bacterium]MDR7454872.1 adenylosuccinate lyase [Armatimonadota bacterium]MDR7497696.1 adenylosuccinate lyase [Armatimonadota bacterium]
MIARYLTPEMRALWSAEQRFDLWLEIELLAVEAQAALGLVPREVAARLRRTARRGTPARIEEIEREQTQHDVVAFLRSVAELTGPDASYLHRGLGSSDVVDTALAVLLVRAADLILDELRSLCGTTAALADRHRGTVMAGRTHGMQAEPITFGVKVAVWHAELGRAEGRLRAAREAVRVGKLSGEVGTFAHTPPEVEAAVCAGLGLLPAPVSSQILQRDRHAEYVAALAILAGTVEKIATELRGLQRTEVGEVEEPFHPGQTGSSAMPHKRNPILCERLCGLARTVRGAVVTALENQALWGERDISHSSAERLILPQVTGLVHYMLRTLRRVLEGLRVFPDVMRRNLEASDGLVFSHRVLLALMAAGRSREDAYAIVQDAARRARDGEGRFRDLVASAGALPASALDACFDLAPYLRHVDLILERAGIPRGASASATGLRQPGAPAVEASAEDAPSGQGGGAR